MADLDIKLFMRDILNKVIADLQENIRTKAPTSYGPMNNTGEALNSLRWKEEGGRFIIYSTMSGEFNHIMTLETGRKPGKMPPREPIQEWLQFRGINPPDISQESLAFLIARKIGREGTQVYRDYTAKGEGTGIILDVVGNREYIQENVLEPLRKELLSLLINQTTPV